MGFGYVCSFVPTVSGCIRLVLILMSFVPIVRITSFVLLKNVTNYVNRMFVACSCWIAAFRTENGKQGKIGFDMILVLKILDIV